MKRISLLAILLLNSSVAICATNPPVVGGDQKEVQYDNQGNIKFVSKGVRQPVFAGEITVKDTTVTDGMAVDVTLPTPALKVIPPVAIR